uniref:Uncharacterized protein n=1 Tax=Cacopsylla melanoneura TaxID=428564 RepID=A0A8D9EYC2_9HEMI
MAGFESDSIWIWTVLKVTLYFFELFTWDLDGFEKRRFCSRCALVFSIDFCKKTKMKKKWTWPVLQLHDSFLFSFRTPSPDLLRALFVHFTVCLSRVSHYNMTRNYCLGYCRNCRNLFACYSTVLSLSILLIYKQGQS